MRAWLRVLLLAVAPVLVVVVPGAAPSHACECIARPLTNYVAGADTVFIGTVLEDSTAHGDTATARVRVTRVYKGTAPKVVTVDTGDPRSSCSESLAEGEEWSFLTVGDDYQTSTCSGSLPVSSNTAAQLEKVLGPGGPPSPGGVAPPGVGEDSEVANVVTQLLVGLALVFALAGAALLILMLRGWARDQR